MIFTWLMTGRERTQNTFIMFAGTQEQGRTQEHKGYKVSQLPSDQGPKLHYNLHAHNGPINNTQHYPYYTTNIMMIMMMVNSINTQNSRFNP